MKNWNIIGKVKAILLALLFLPNLFFPMPTIPEIGIGMALVPLMFASFAIPFITKLNKAFFNSTIEKPNWNDNPINIKRPLSFFQFAAYSFLSIGISLIIGAEIHYATFQKIALIIISFGIGILIGIHLTLKWKRE